MKVLIVEDEKIIRNGKNGAWKKCEKHQTQRRR